MKTLKYISLFLAGFIMYSCSESWLDVNTDPNKPADVVPELVFPEALISVGSQITVRYNIAGGMWAQFWTQNPTSNQYKQFDAYDIVNTTLENEWDELYSGTLKELQSVITAAEEKEDWRLVLMATTMKAYTYQYLVDLYDKVPYTEALKAEDNITAPQYDDGSVVYDGLIKEIDAAMAKDFSKNVSPITSDFLFQGDVNQWIKFANTLKLRMYIREWKAREPIAKAGITALLADNDFLDVDAQIDVFIDEKGKGNPLYESDRRELNTKTNIRASHTFISWLNANADTRLTSYFSPGTTGLYIGNPQGDFNKVITADEANQMSLANIQANDPIIFISAAESYFLQAEAQLKLGNTADVKALYDMGVNAAFARFGLDGSAFVAPGGAYEYDANNALESIITQKWASLAGINGMEAYIEHLRTGFPVRTTKAATAEDYVPGQFTQPIQSVLPVGQFPKRLVFPASERKSNENTPAEVKCTVATWWQ